MEAGQRKAQRSWMLFLYSFACSQSSPAHYPGLGLLVRTPHSWAHVPLDLSELLLLILICGTVCYKQIGILGNTIHLNTPLLGLSYPLE